MSEHEMKLRIERLEMAFVFSVRYLAAPPNDPYRQDALKYVAKLAKDMEADLVDVFDLIKEQNRSVGRGLK